MPLINPKQFIVEGPTDLFSVAGLMRAHVPSWPTGKPRSQTQVPVWIQPEAADSGNSVEKILAPDYLPTLLKSSAITHLGIMLDADENPAGRYQRLRDLCLGQFPELPISLPVAGLVQTNADKKRLGFWIMPDNHTPGTLETFLRLLVRPLHEPIWAHAVASVVTGRQLGAGCREKQVDKANLFTFLAWQDEPGQSPGTAITRQCLDPQSAHAAPFVRWFRELFEV